MLKRALCLTIPLLLATALPAQAQVVEVVLKVVNVLQPNVLAIWANSSTGWNSGPVTVAAGQTSEQYQGWEPLQNPIQDFQGTITVPGRGCMVKFRTRMTIGSPGGSSNNLVIENVQQDSHGLACLFAPQCTSVAVDAGMATCTATITIP